MKTLASQKQDILKLKAKIDTATEGTTLHLYVFPNNINPYRQLLPCITRNETATLTQYNTGSDTPRHVSVSIQ